ncbi:MAG: hypothetical protein EPO28_01630 [Saprospiraceae bacterium]|nr:MAG: hypothetical protein EPO28_01630 [Saprospiraceae bacterium]
MKVSLEISMYPLDQHYGTPVLQFIERLRRNSSLVVHSNNMSTQVFGEYDEVMAALTKEMKDSFQENDTVAMVLKVVNSDLRL